MGAAGLAGVLTAACAGSSQSGQSGQPRPSEPTRSASPRPADGGAATPQEADPAPLLELERRYGARLGVFAANTGTGRTIRHRQDERFAMCSVFKTYLVAALLRSHPLGSGYFGQRVPFTRADLVLNSPVTGSRVEDGTAQAGMTVAELCEATITCSDNTAANLLLRLLGGPGEVTSFARSIGDPATRLDRWEPELNTAVPGDPRDTTTPAAIAAGYRALVLGDALPGPERQQLAAWLIANTTGGTRLRAGLPPEWAVGDKTGAGKFGTLNDVAIAWPPDGEPWVIAVLSDRPAESASGDDALLAEAARAVVTALRA